MRKYKARVFHNVEILLDNDSKYNSNEWLEILASNIAYFKSDVHGKYIKQEIEIKEI